jgi:hypothetical protein
MNIGLWIVLGLAVILVLGYVLTMRDLFRKSREVEKRIDYGKIRKWQDDDED